MSQPRSKVSEAVEACLAACRTQANQRDTFAEMAEHYGAQPDWTMGDLFELRREFFARVLDSFERGASSDGYAPREIVRAISTPSTTLNRVDALSGQVVERCRAGGRGLSALAEILEVLRADPDWSETELAAVRTTAMYALT